MLTRVYICGNSKFAALLQPLTHEQINLKLNNDTFTEGDLIKLVIACLDSKSTPEPHEREWSQAVLVPYPVNRKPCEVTLVDIGERCISFQIRNSYNYGGYFSLPLIVLAHSLIEGYYTIENSSFMIARSETKEEGFIEGKFVTETAIYQLILDQGSTLPRLGSVEELWKSAMHEELDEDKSPVRRLSDLFR